VEDGLGGLTLSFVRWRSSIHYQIQWLPHTVCNKNIVEDGFHVGSMSMMGEYHLIPHVRW